MFMNCLLTNYYIESVPLVKKQDEKIQLGGFGLRKDCKKV